MGNLEIGLPAQKVDRSPGPVEIDGDCRGGVELNSGAVLKVDDRHLICPGDDVRLKTHRAVEKEKGRGCHGEKNDGGCDGFRKVTRRGFYAGELRVRLDGLACVAHQSLGGTIGATVFRIVEPVREVRPVFGRLLRIAVAEQPVRSLAVALSLSVHRFVLTHWYLQLLPCLLDVWHRRFGTFSRSEAAGRGSGRRRGADACPPCFWRC
ncbi:hypothetical protein D3C78_1013270 [compost metagenome]